jgi:hypothetical protein
MIFGRRPAKSSQTALGQQKAGCRPLSKAVLCRAVQQHAVPVLRRFFSSASSRDMNTLNIYTAYYSTWLIRLLRNAEGFTFTKGDTQAPDEYSYTLCMGARFISSNISSNSEV